MTFSNNLPDSDFRPDYFAYSNIVVQYSCSPKDCGLLKNAMCLDSQGVCNPSKVFKCAENEGYCSKPLTSQRCINNQSFSDLCEGEAPDTCETGLAYIKKPSSDVQTEIISEACCTAGCASWPGPSSIAEWGDINEIDCEGIDITDTWYDCLRTDQCQVRRKLISGVWDYFCSNNCVSLPVENCPNPNHCYDNICEGKHRTCVADDSSGMCRMPEKCSEVPTSRCPNTSFGTNKCEVFNKKCEDSSLHSNTSTRTGSSADSRILSIASFVFIALFM